MAIKGITQIRDAILKSETQIWTRKTTDLHCTVILKVTLRKEDKEKNFRQQAKDVLTKLEQK